MAGPAIQGPVEATKLAIARKPVLQLTCRRATTGLNPRSPGTVQLQARGRPRSRTIGLAAEPADARSNTRPEQPVNAPGPSPSTNRPPNNQPSYRPPSSPSSSHRLHHHLHHHLQMIGRTLAAQKTIGRPSARRQPRRLPSHQAIARPACSQVTVRRLRHRLHHRLRRRPRHRLQVTGRTLAAQKTIGRIPARRPTSGPR